MKKVLTVLAFVLLMIGCLTYQCPSPNMEETDPVEVTKTEVKHVVTIRFYWNNFEDFEIDGEEYVGLHDALRGPFRAAINTIQEAVDGRVKFIETNHMLAADIVVCGTYVEPDTLAYFWGDYSILAINLNSGINDIKATLVHELLHSLGLKHSGDVNSIMWWASHGGVGVAIFTKEDKINLLRILDGE